MQAAQGGCTGAGQSPNSPGKLQLARRAGRAGVGALSAPSVQRGMWARTTGDASAVEPSTCASGGWRPAAGRAEGERRD